MEAGSAAEKLAICSSYGKYPWSHGEKARYNSINTFVLSAAMQSYLQGKEGPQADIWDMVLEEVYRPIGIFHAPILRTVEPDGSRGIPIFGYGLYATADDIAKVAQLYQDGGQHDGLQLLPAAWVADALYRTADQGLPNGEYNAYGQGRYHLSFWGAAYRSQGGASYVIPYMSGFGGNHVALMPNGMTIFRLSDGLVYGVDEMIRAADAMRAFPPQ
jgi:CubicO group peptidase (beta-lactamase class C family)